jgi:hypothetical protein
MTTSEELQPASGPPAGWAARLLAAARVASDNGELWLPGALATMSSIGWLPFVLAVVPLPSDGDLAFFASSLVLAPSYPLNIVLPAVALVCAVACATLLSAAGEAVLLRAIGRLRGRGPAQTSIDDEAVRVWLIRLVASLPVMVVIGLLLVMIRAVGPGEYQSPDLGRGPLLVRIAADVWPIFILGAVAISSGQAFAAAALRANLGPAVSIPSALGMGLRDLVRHPLQRLSQSVAVEAGLAAWLVATWALLRLLWIPIGRHAQDGTLMTPVSLALLVGFVATWLCLVAGAGVLHVWSSAWWSLEDSEAGTVRLGRNDGEPWT